MSLNTGEAIDKWETALRLVAAIYEMDYNTTKRFIEKTLVNSTLRFWKHLSIEIKNTIFSDNDSNNMITRAVEAFTLEFTGDGNILRNRTKVKKYEQD